MTFERGTSQLLSFFSPQTDKVDVKCSAPYVRASLCLPLPSKPGNCTPSTKLQLPEVSTELPAWSSAAYKMALLRNTVIEIIVIEMCHDARVGVTHLQK